MWIRNWKKLKYDDKSGKCVSCVILVFKFMVCVHLFEAVCSQFICVCGCVCVRAL